jgi:acyl-CoA-binding protein
VYVVQSSFTNFLVSHTPPAASSDDGSLLFPTAQTPSIQLSYQFAASEGSLERTFQEALLFVGSHKYLMDTMAELQLRLFALHKKAIDGKVRKPRGLFDVVGQAKYRAFAKLEKEKMSKDRAREEFVNLVQQFFPEWKVMLAGISEVPISQAVLKRLEQALSGPRGGGGIDVKAHWVPDRHASSCMRCGAVAFTLTKRRHHCRLCGLVVCDGCSPQRVELPRNLGVEGLHRVCNVCASATWRQAEEKVGEGGGRRRMNSRTKMRMSGEKIRAPTLL